MSNSYSGQLQTSLHSGLKMTFDYTYTIDKEERRAKVTWKVSPYPYDDPDEDRGNAHYHLAKGQQKLVIKWKRLGDNKSYSYNEGDHYVHNGNTVYRGYADKGSSLDGAYNGKEFFDTNGNWTGIRRWVFIEGTGWLNGSFNVDYDNDGEASFYVKGDFAWWSPVNPTKRMIFEKTVKLKSIPRAYTVKYDANGGSGAPDSQKKIQGETLTLRKGVPTLSGFTFAGWGTSSTDTSPNYQPKGSYTKDAKITLYAVWKHDVTYYSNGGNLSGTNKQTKYSKTPLTLFGTNKASRAGYILSGWTSSSVSPSASTSNTNLYSVGGQFTNNSITSLYAYWKYQTNIPVTLKEYYSNNVLVGDRKVTVDYDHLFTASNQEVFKGYSRAGYKLLGWSKKKTSVYLTAPSASELSSLLFDYTKRYTDNPVGITLYPVLQYSTTCYIHVDGVWKLAVPYVNENGVWKQTLMYCKDSGEWKL